MARCLKAEECRAIRAGSACRYLDEVFELYCGFKRAIQRQTGVVKQAKLVGAQAELFDQTRVVNRTCRLSREEGQQARVI